MFDDEIKTAMCSLIGTRSQTFMRDNKTGLHDRKAWCPVPAPVWP